MQVNCETTNATSRKSACAVYYALTVHAKVKVCVSNFPLDICWRIWVFRRGNLETPVSRSYKCFPQNFIKDTPTAVSLYGAVQKHLVYLIHWCTRYIRKFFRKRHHRQMRRAFFKTGRSVILLRDSTTNNARPGIRVVATDRCYIIQEKHDRIYLNTMISDGFTVRGTYKAYFIF